MEHISRQLDPNGADLPSIKEILGKKDPSAAAERSPSAEGNFYQPLGDKIGPGMNPRIQCLRRLSFEAEPSIAIERALHQTSYYKEHYGKHSIPVLRALTFFKI